MQLLLYYLLTLAAASLDLNKCYKRLDSGASGVSWAVARTQCQADSADLASVTSELENTGGCHVSLGPTRAHQS